jgi:hypothetical protein
MTQVEVIDAKLWHVGRIARMLRPEHAAALVRMGINSHRELRATFEASYVRKAMLIDGKLAGIGGIMGPLLSPIGFAWIAISDRATRYPVALVKEVRKHLAEEMKTKAELHTTIMVDDLAARRFAVFLGWHVADEGLGAAAETRPGRRTLHDHIASTPELLVPFRGSHLIKMGYHASASGDLPGLSN